MEVDYWEDPDLDGRVIFKLFLKKWVGGHALD
jgi:hypothetical protein